MDKRICGCLWVLRQVICRVEKWMRIAPLSRPERNEMNEWVHPTCRNVWIELHIVQAVETRMWIQSFGCAYSQVVVQRIDRTDVDMFGVFQIVLGIEKPMGIPALSRAS